MQCRKGKINWSLSITCEKIAQSIHHKEDSDESQFTVSFEVESLLFFASWHYDCKKKIYQEGGKVKQIVCSTNRGTSVENKKEGK